MKKILLLTGVACLLGTQANAGNYILNPYVSAKARYSIMDNSLKSNENWSSPDESDNYSEKNSIDDNVFGGSIALGLRTQLIRGALRTEFEYSKNADAKKSKTDDWGDKFELKLKSEAFMFNAYYDIETNSPITPYVGAGLGFSRLKASEKWNDYPEDNDSIKHTNFAWQIGAGVAYNINRNLALDLGYRYMDYGHFSKTESGSDEIYEWTDKYKVESKAHEILAGVRYTF